MKKIVFVINYFYPDLASTGQLMTDLCFDLRRDFNITVIASQPGYAGERIDIKTKLFEVEQLDNLKIIRIRLPKVDKRSKISRARYILLYFLYALIALIKERDTDIIYTISQPPILGGLIGTLGKLLKGSKHVYNIQDFNPEQAAVVNFVKSNNIIYKVAKLIDNINCRYSDKIVLVGNDMAETLKKRFKGEKVPDYSIINNWTNEKEVIPLSKEHYEVKRFLTEHDLRNKFIVMYSGNLGLFYDLENIIKITNKFVKKSDIVFLFIGEGAVKSQMQNYVVENHQKNVVFLPYQPKNFIRYSLNAADIHLVVNQKGIKGISVPSKIYGVMAAGKPILGVLEKGSEAQTLIEKSGSGKVVEPKDYDGIVRAIEDFYRMEKKDLIQMGLNGRKYLEKHLTKEKSINKYREILNRL